MEEEIAVTLGRNLWRTRRRAGYSQEELGALCGLHRTEIGQLENGKRLPRVDTLIKLAGALEIEADELLKGIAWTVPAPTPEGGFVIETPLRGPRSHGR